LFLHPLTGLADGASKTAEGLVNSVSFKVGEGRARKIRVFYDSEQYFAIYNEEDSNNMEYLRSYKKGKFENLFFKKAIHMKSDSCLLIFTLQRTILMRVGNGKKIWGFRNENFDTLEKYTDGIRIRLKEKLKKTDVFQFFKIIYSFLCLQKISSHQKILLYYITIIK
jgi:hypothetical protein